MKRGLSHEPQQKGKSDRERGCIVTESTNYAQTGSQHQIRKPEGDMEGKGDSEIVVLMTCSALNKTCFFYYYYLSLKSYRIKKRLGIFCTATE